MRPLTYRPDLVSLTAVVAAPVPAPASAISYVTVVERKVVTVTRGQMVTVRGWTSPFPTRSYSSVPTVGNVESDAMEISTYLKVWMIAY